MMTIIDKIMLIFGFLVGMVFFMVIGVEVFLSYESINFVAESWTYLVIMSVLCLIVAIFILSYMISALVFIYILIADIILTHKYNKSKDE